jgi:hypothetical protein
MLCVHLTFVTKAALAALDVDQRHQPCLDGSDVSDDATVNSDVNDDDEDPNVAEQRDEGHTQ